MKRQLLNSCSITAILIDVIILEGIAVRRCFLNESRLQYALPANFNVGLLVKYQ